MSYELFTVLAALTLFSYFFGYKRAKGFISKKEKLNSLPKFHGYYLALWAFLINLVLIILITLLGESFLFSYLFENLSMTYPDLDVQQLQNDLGHLSFLSLEAQSALYNGLLQEYLNDFSLIKLCVFLIGSFSFTIMLLFVAHRKIKAKSRIRNHFENTIEKGLLVASCLAIFTTVGIVMSLLFEAMLFFQKIPFFDFLFGIHWSPQTAIRADQVASGGSFGFIPLFTGTLLITFIAMCVAIPTGLFSAIYMSDYASPKLRSYLKPILEILAGIPTVVFGFFAALVVAPLIRSIGESIGLDVASESALAAGLVMGIMIIPFVSSLSDDVISAVPKSIRDGSYGLGATKSETIKKVILPAALPGIIASFLLAISRAIGETMIVVMAAGLRANLTLNPLEDVTTVTVQIVTLLTGDQEFDSAKTLSVFALGLVLFFVTLSMNIGALKIVKKYREKYE